MKRFMKMNIADTVATALEDTKKGNMVQIYDINNEPLDTLQAQEDIWYGNKIGLCDISKGSHVIKYGGKIGECTEDIKKGCLVHVHNVRSYSVNVPPIIIEVIKKQMKIGGENNDL